MYVDVAVLADEVAKVLTQAAQQSWGPNELSAHLQSVRNHCLCALYSFRLCSLAHLSPGHSLYNFVFTRKYLHLHPLHIPHRLINVDWRHR